MCKFELYHFSQLEGASAQAKDPLKAAKVYENIVNAVNEAEKAATEASQVAQDAYDTASKSGLTDRAKSLKHRSENILEEAKALNATGKIYLFRFMKLTHETV